MKIENRLCSKTIGKRIKDVIWNERMTQKELSLKTGLTENAISRYINGSRIPNVKSLILISEALNVSCDYLLGLKEINHES